MPGNSTDIIAPSPGPFQETLGGLGPRWHLGVVHACSTVAAITASQTVPVSGGSAAASALRASSSMPW